MHLGSCSWLLLLRFMSTGSSIFDFSSKKQNFCSNISITNMKRLAGDVTSMQHPVVQLQMLNLSASSQIWTDWMLMLSQYTWHRWPAPQRSHDFGEGSSTLALTLENFAFHSSTRKKSDNWMSLSWIINVPRSFKPSSPHLMLWSLCRAVVISHRWSCLWPHELEAAPPLRTRCSACRPVCSEQWTC